MFRREKEKHLREVKEVRERHAIDLEEKERCLQHQEEQLKEAEKVIMEKVKELQEVYGKLRELDQQLVSDYIILSIGSSSVIGMEKCKLYHCSRDTTKNEYL